MCFHLISQEENTVLRWGKASFSRLLEEETLSVSKERCCHLAVVKWLELAVVGFALCWGCGEGNELADCALQPGVKQ